jgi:hypothetical protein
MPPQVALPPTAWLPAAVPMHPHNHLWMTAPSLIIPHLQIATAHLIQKMMISRREEMMAMSMSIIQRIMLTKRGASL